MIYYLILIIVVLDFVWTQYLSYRNRKKMTALIPESLKDIYNQELYTKQQNYQKENSRMSFISGSISFAVLLIILLIGGFGWVDSIIRENISNPVLVTLVFLGILYSASTVFLL